MRRMWAGNEQQEITMLQGIVTFIFLASSNFNDVIL